MDIQFSISFFFFLRTNHPIHWYLSSTVTVTDYQEKANHPKVMQRSNYIWPNAWEIIPIWLKSNGMPSNDRYSTNTVTDWMHNWGVYACWIKFPEPSMGRQGLDEEWAVLSVMQQFSSLSMKTVIQVNLKIKNMKMLNRNSKHLQFDHLAVSFIK